MKSTLVKLLLIVWALTTLAACQQKNEHPVVVHVYRDRNGPAASWLSEQIGNFQKAKIRTSNGKPIVVATAEPKDYHKTLADLGGGLKPDLVVLDSESDAQANQALRADLHSASRLCPGQDSCPAFVPSWASGEAKEAAQALLSFLMSHRRT